MTFHELIEQLKHSLTPEQYEKHKQDLDDLAFKIDVENQDLSIRDQKHG